MSRVEIRGERSREGNCRVVWCERVKERRESETINKTCKLKRYVVDDQNDVVAPHLWLLGAENGGVGAVHDFVRIW